MIIKWNILAFQCCWLLWATCCVVVILSAFYNQDRRFAARQMTLGFFEGYKETPGYGILQGEDAQKNGSPEPT